MIYFIWKLRQVSAIVQYLLSTPVLACCQPSNFTYSCFIVTKMIFKFRNDYVPKLERVLVLRIRNCHLKSQRQANSRELQWDAKWAWFQTSFSCLLFSWVAAFHRGMLGVPATGLPNTSLNSGIPPWKKKESVFRGTSPYCSGELLLSSVPGCASPSHRVLLDVAQTVAVGSQSPAWLTLSVPVE